MNAPLPIAELDAEVEQISTDAERVSAVARLTFARARDRDRSRAEAVARLDLAAAIMRLDEAEESDDVLAGMRHTVGEQLEVEKAMRAYAQALADFVRA